jgi:putative hydroxymethylpyrimidine transport system substrate-binding protein
MNQKILFVIIGVIILITVGYVLVVQNSPEEQAGLIKVYMALDWFPWSEHVGFFIAKEKGYFADEGLDVELRVAPDPATIIQTIASGRDDFSINPKYDLLVARDQGVPVVSIMALYQHPVSAVMSLEDSSIETPKDLAGKKIGWTGVPQHEKMMDTILQKQGLSLKDVEMINVGFDLVPALIGKKVDAIAMGYWVWESIMSEKQGFPVNIMKINEYGIPDHYELVVITNEDKIKNNPELVQKFVKAVKRGYEDAIRDPEGAVQLFKKTNPEVDVDVERRSTELQIPLWKSEKGFGWQEESRWLNFAQWMKDNGLLSQGVDARKAFTNSFVENVQ